jgi:hypothetical protein
MPAIHKALGTPQASTGIEMPMSNERALRTGAFS